MAITIKIDTKNIVLDQYTFDKEHKYLAWNSSTNEIDVSLNIKLPFKLNKLPDFVFDPEHDIDRVILFRNTYFAERNIVRLKIPYKGENQIIGYIFSLSTLLDKEGIHRENDKVRPYIIRAILALFTNKTGFTAETHEYRADSDYSLADFFPNDILICVISKQLLPIYDEDIETSILYHLNLYGFYFLEGNRHKDFYPQANKLRKLAFESLLNDAGEAVILTEILNKDLLNEEFVRKYIRELLNSRQDNLSKFLLSYQIFEVLIDKVTKYEIQSKIIDDPNILSTRGYHIKKLLEKISGEAHRINMIFNKYCFFKHDSAYNLCFDIGELFQKNFDTSKDSGEPATSNNEKKVDTAEEKAKAYGSYFYEFRNMVVHNTKIMYSGTDEDINFKSESLSAIVLGTEFLSIEAVTSFANRK